MIGVESGKLHRRVSFHEDAQGTQNSYGEHAPEKKQLVSRRWVKIEPLRGRELYGSEATQAIASHRVTMRYWKPLREDMWLEYGSRRLNIVSIDNVGEMNVEHELMCLEEK